MPLSNDQFRLLQLGYLSGEDLMNFAPAQLLIKQNIVLPGQPQDGCDLAYAEIEASLVNRYNVATELERRAPLQGTATATLGGGAVTGLVLVYEGGKYLQAPTVAFTGGGGAGAAAVAEIDDNGNLTGFTVTDDGSNYTSAPTVTLSGGLAPDGRAKLLVKIAAVIAVRNILGSAQNIGEAMDNLFKWADKTLLAIRNAQMNLPLPYPAQVPITLPDGRQTSYNPGDDAKLVGSSFKFIG